MDHSHDAEHIAAHIGAYLKVGIGLLILTGVTVALSYVDFGSRANNIIVGMIVATFKASLVAAIFMHLKGEKMINLPICLSKPFTYFLSSYPSSLPPGFQLGRSRPGHRMLWDL